MTYSARQVAVVGAGVVGASIAYHLARRGVRPLLIDGAAGPGLGVTAQSFGWVNLINGDLANALGFALRRKAVEEFERLGTALPQALASAKRGALVWKRTPNETERLAGSYRAAGVVLDLVGQAQVASMEPNLRSPPPCAVSCPGDLALDPVHLASTLVEAARELGAEVFFRQTVVGLATYNGRVTGVVTGAEVVPADAVVLAAGAGLPGLLATLGIEVGLELSPAFLLRFSAGAPLAIHIVKAPDLEIRPTTRGDLLVAKSASAPTATADSVAQAALAAIGRQFVGGELVRFQAASLGHRPIFADGLPRLGFLPGISGAYVAAGHPGVILAPLLGRLAAAELLDDISPDGILRPSRQVAMA
ncbi:MAG TPA: FAD-binding oxidoreductase [Microvirga sp.]|jgi:glycine/D-amino acid oxidase-like deaminating enzyme|nr:FAD-binding oxidoreductase [Microvirga sp.]